MHNLSTFKENFDPILQKYLDSKIEGFIKNTKDTSISDLVNYTKELVSHGGKRIRPYLAFVMYVGNGGKEKEKILDILVSLEIFHIFALVHDDIMDNGDVRHGIKTIHKFWEEKLLSESKIGNLGRIGQSQAILVGDFLLSWSTEIFSNDNLFPTLQRAKKYYYKMVDEVILGQMLDVDITTRENPNKELIDEKTRLKTSRYSFVRPMEIGAALATDKNVEDFCESFGTNLGITFQLQDDLLDIIGDPKLLNKNILSDVSQGQHTFFTNFIFENGNDKEQQTLRETLRGKIEKKDYERVQNIFYSSGAIEEGKKIIAKGLTESETLVNSSSLNDESKIALLDLIELIRKRSLT